MNKKQFFTKNLMAWFATNHRPLPWKGEKNPYLIWLSEIILQQTRVEQGLPYFERFCAAYPQIEDLAKAPEDEVMKLWEGLGYYSRARNLHFTAKLIADKYQGVFPTTYKEVLALKGVGPYTAAAITSFAYDLPHAVVDGNVYRVLSRFFGIATPIDTTAGKKEFNQLAQELLDTTQPGNYNQAIMDFGATHCTPKAPKCKSCSFAKNCTALKKELVQTLPVKAKKLVKKERYFHYLVFNYSGAETFVEKRVAKDIWQNLYQFPLVETDKIEVELAKLQASEVWKKFVGTNDFILKKTSKPFKQTLTHRYIIGTFWEIEVNIDPPQIKPPYVRTNRKNLSKFAFPKIIDWYLQDNSLYLELF
ncbi:MAG: A/G-specific adenine glycosylase [Saprospiraceae bacterium]